jgi:hypothetical protein
VRSTAVNSLANILSFLVALIDLVKAIPMRDYCEIGDHAGARERRQSLLLRPNDRMGTAQT